MIGSDWPVCTLSASYESAMGIVLEYIAQFPAAEQEGILGGNCARFYALPKAKRDPTRGATARLELHLNKISESLPANTSFIETGYAQSIETQCRLQQL